MPQFGQGKPSAGAFYDTDFGSIDDLLAVSLLYGMQGKNDCRVATVTLSRANLAIAGFVDMVVRFYHGPAGNFSQLTPVGMRTDGAPGDTSPAYTKPFEKKKSDGAPVYKNQVATVIDTGDPLTLIRNYLMAQADQNAFFVLSGPATNLARVVTYPGLKPLIAAKAKYLVIAGGAFPSGEAEAHIKADIPAAQKLLAEWPTPIVFSGSEVGAAFEFPGAAIDKQFVEAAPENPVAQAYRDNRPMPYDIPSWAMAAALHAGRPKEGYFKLSAPGAVTISNDGRTTFAASEKGTHQYLIADPAQKEKITLAYVELASAKPPEGRRMRPPAAAQKDGNKPDPEKTTPPPPKQ